MRDCIISYLKNLIELFSENKIFIDVESNNVSDIYLSFSSHNNISSYSDILSEDSDISDYSNNDENQDNISSNPDKEIYANEVHSVISVIEDVRRLIIVGDPGSGKTTILRYLALRYATSFLSEEGETLPVYIQLSEIHDNSSLISKINNIISSLSVDNLFHSGNIVLMLDGLNEVTTSRYNSIMDDINSVIEKYPEISVIITSRKFGFKNDTVLPVYEIHEFTDKNIKDFIQKHTSSLELYNIIMRNSAFSELVTNPLLLSMVTNVWLKEGVLPAKRSELYEMFVNFQLDKTWSLLPDKHFVDKNEICSLLSQIAFSMRFSGFISEGLESFHELLSEYIAPGKLDLVCNILVKTGILKMEAISIECKYISFMHETFQEYFAALYVANRYLEKGVLEIDLHNYNWRESLQLVVEILDSKLEPELFVEFLGRLSAFLNQTDKYDSIESSHRNHASTDGNVRNCINMRLPLLVEACSGVMHSNSICKNWIGQYLLLNMENYMKMSVDDRTDELFELISHAILRFKSGSVFRLLFRDIRWLKEWLYHEDELEEVLFHPEPNSKYNILIELTLDSEIRAFVLDEIIQLRNELDCIHVLCLRLKRFYDLLYNNLSSRDFKELYMSTGNTKYLFMTLNPNFIESRLQEIDNPDYTGYQALLLHGNKECVEYCFNSILPRYFGKSGKIISNKLLEPVVRNYPSLVEVMLKSNYVDKRRLFEICYEIPRELLPKYYFYYIERRIHNKFYVPYGTSLDSVLINNVEKKQTYSIQIKLLKKISLLSNMHLVTLDVGLSKKNAKKYLSEVFERTIQLSTLNVYTYKMVEIENIPSSYLTGTLVLESLEFCDGVAYNVNDDILEILVIKSAATDLNIDRRLYAVVYNGKYYNLDFRDKRNTFATYLYSETNKEFKMEVAQSQKVVDVKEIKENWCFYRFEDLASVIYKDNSGFSAKDMLQLGIIGFMPTLIKSLSKIEMGVVRSVMGNKVIVCFLKSQEIRTLKHKFEYYKPGDIIIYYNDELYAKLHDDQRIPEYGYATGVVAFSYNTNVFIVSNADNNRYYFYDKESKCSVGDKVSFFPSVNGSKRHRTSLTAYNVKKITE